MTIIDKIKTSVEGATGLPFLYHAAGEINELVARANSLPISFAFLLDSGTIEDVNGRYHERVTLAVMFTDKTEFDFNALENEEIIDRMKVKAYKWLDSLRNSNDLQIVSVNSTQRLYDTTTDILTGYAVNITLQDMQGVGECELPEVVIPITENGIYNVVGVDKVDVKLFVTLKDLYVTRNGVYNPQDFGAYGFGSVNVNVHREEDLVPAYDWLKNRVKGSEDGTIPAILLKEPFDAINLVENLSVLDNRRITNGGGEITPDGVSLIRMMSDVEFVGEYSTRPNIMQEGKLTEIIDDNNEWGTCVRRVPNHFAKKVRMNCSRIRSSDALCLKYGYFNSAFINLEEVEFPYLEYLDNTQYGNSLGYSVLFAGCPKLKRVYLPKLIGLTRTSAYYLGIIANCPLIEEIDLPSYRGVDLRPAGESYAGFRNNTNLRTIKFNGLVNGNFQNQFNNAPKLMHFEISVGLNTHLNVSSQYGDGWTPTMALRTDTTAEDYVDLREDMTFANNLEQFLYNFQTYIADRVADRTGQSALRLTVMPAIYAALESQEGQTILATLTNKNWTVVQY